MASVENHDEVAAVALMTPPHNLIISWTVDDSALEAIARELHAKAVTVPGVNSSADIARKFALKWSELSGHTFRVQMAQRIYQLSRVTNETRVAGHLREPNQSDDALLCEWRAAFSIDAEGMDPGQAREAAALPLPHSRRLLLWEVEGTAVSMAGFSGPTPNGIRVAWVYTPPENRGKGFAGACVAALSQKSARRRPQVLLSVHRPCQRDLESRLPENRIRTGHRRRRLLILVGISIMNTKQLFTSVVR